MKAYDRLLGAKRARKSTQSNRDIGNEALSDKSRIIPSTAIRRLQTKAQVFSLEENSAIRTRLTHTLEVAMYGELIANKVFNALLKRRKVEESQRLPFVKTIENACLLHDVGNPPFGHLGEFAIRAWFEENKPVLIPLWKSCNLDSNLAEQYFEGFANFDGNAQSFRIVTKLQWFKDEYGLNLTYSLLASIIKYLNCVPSPEPFSKKAGYFETDRKNILQIWKYLGLKALKQRPIQRHPFVFLMEAADDISFCLSDIEDAIEKGVITQEQFYESLPRRIRKKVPVGDDLNKSKYWKFLEFRISITRELVDIATNAYVKNHEKILAGMLQTSLLECDKYSDNVLKCLKRFARRNIFLSREAVEVELGGHNVILTILNKLKVLLLLSKTDFEKVLHGSQTPPDYGKLSLELRLASLLPVRHVNAYRFLTNSNRLLEPIYRTHLILDYVTGMTDRHAIKMFRIIEGISAGNGG